MPDQEDLKLQLSVESDDAQKQVAEALASIEGDVKQLADTFGGVSDKLKGVADQFESLKTKTASNMSEVLKSTKGVTKEVENLTGKQKQGVSEATMSGKVLSAVWKDLTSGLKSLKQYMTDLVGLRGGMLAGVGVTGGLVALLVGSFVTVDNLNAAVKGVTATSAGLRGEFNAFKSGQFDKDWSKLRGSVSSVMGEFQLSSDAVLASVKAATSLGFAVRDVSKDTLEFATSMDIATGSQFGTYMSGLAETAKEYGQNLNEANRAQVELIRNFSGFIEKNRVGAITIMDLVGSLEIASRSLRGWQTDWQSLSELQMKFIAEAEKMGMTTKGAGEAFANLAQSVDNLDKAAWAGILMKMKEAGGLLGPSTAGMTPAALKVRESYARLQEQWGGAGSPLASIQAARMMTRETQSKGGGDLSVWMAGVLRSMKELPAGKDASVVASFLEESMGLTKENAANLALMNVDVLKKIEQGIKTGSPDEKEFAKHMAKFAEDTSQASMTLAEKITAGIMAWWRQIAPNLFLTFINLTTLIVDAISSMPGMPDAKNARERLAAGMDLQKNMLFSMWGTTKEAFEKMAEGAGASLKDAAVGGEFGRKWMEIRNIGKGPKTGELDYIEQHPSDITGGEGASIGAMPPTMMESLKKKLGASAGSIAAHATAAAVTPGAGLLINLVIPPEVGAQWLQMLQTKTEGLSGAKK